VAMKEKIVQSLQKKPQFLNKICQGPSIACWALRALNKLQKPSINKVQTKNKLTIK
jgi:hypothetical protein